MKRMCQQKIILFKGILRDWNRFGLLIKVDELRIGQKVIFMFRIHLAVIYS